MPDMIPVHEAISSSTPPLALAPHARARMIEALQFKPSDQRVGGWDGGYTQGTNVKSYQRENVGIIEINGLLWTHDDPTAYWIGLTTYESIAAEIGRMVNDEGIDGVVLSFNSPGGMVAGIDELAAAIFDARSDLALGIIAHVMGEAASAAYWAASAASEIVVVPTATLGSIGAVLGVYRGNGGDDGGDGVVEFVSSVSPLKRVDPETKEGRNEYQSTVDKIGEVFVDTVAQNRGVSVETVLSDFGQGGELVGEQAINAGMADRIGSLEQVITEMRSAVGGSSLTEGTTMGLKTNKNTQTAAVPAPPQAQAEPTPAQPSATVEPVASQVDVQATVAAERERSAGILEAVQGTGLEAKAGEYIAAGSSVAEVNAAIVAHMKATPPQAAAPAVPDNGTLNAMRQESASASQVDGGNGGVGDTDKQASEKKAFEQAWAAGAQNAIAKGGVRKVEA